MSSGRGLAVGVACLVVLAGCGAFVGGSSQPDRETVTPVPVPGSEAGDGSDATADGSNRAGVNSDGTGAGTGAPPTPPGVSPDGTVDVTALASAHGAYLATRSYNWTYRYRVTGGGTGPFTRVRQIRAETDAVLVRDTIPRLGTNTSMYVTDGVGYFRTSHASGPAFREVDRPRDRGPYTSLAGELVRKFLANVSFTVTVVERDGQPYYRLHAADATPSRSLRLVWREAHNYTVTAYVTPAGLVRTVVAEYDYLPRGSGQPADVAHVSFRSDYAAIGSTTVDRPAWVFGVTSTPTAAPATSPTPETPPSPTSVTTNSTSATTDSPPRVPPNSSAPP